MGKSNASQYANFGSLLKTKGHESLSENEIQLLRRYVHLNLCKAIAANELMGLLKC